VAARDWLGEAESVVGEALVALSRAAKAPPPPGRFLAVDATRHRVTITLIASYDGENGGFNFDGYSRNLMWTVPRGWDGARRVREPRAASAFLRSCVRSPPAGTGCCREGGQARRRPLRGNWPAPGLAWRSRRRESGSDAIVAAGREMDLSGR